MKSFSIVCGLFLGLSGIASAEAAMPRPYMIYLDSSRPTEFLQEFRVRCANDVTEIAENFSDAAQLNGVDPATHRFDAFVVPSAQRPRERRIWDCQMRVVRSQAVADFSWIAKPTRDFRSGQCEKDGESLELDPLNVRVEVRYWYNLGLKRKCRASALRVKFKS